MLRKPHAAVMPTIKNAQRENRDHETNKQGTNFAGSN